MTARLLGIASKGALLGACLALSLALAACAGDDGDGGNGSESITTGEPFVAAASVHVPQMQGSATETGTIDLSGISRGYVCVAAQNSDARLKFQVAKDEMSYNYDLPGDGTPLVVPLSMGEGTYRFRVMQNTSGNNYVELSAQSCDVVLESEFAPFLIPNVYCDFTENSQCVAQARKLTASAQNQGDAVAAICDYVVKNIAYETEKASQLKDASGYVPNPDETLASGTGICFDYASLGAAMLRSVGIPCKIITGYVSPEDIYHAWIMVYIDGTWKTGEFSVDRDTWSRVDLTFAASSKEEGLVGDGKTYTDRYVY